MPAPGQPGPRIDGVTYLFHAVGTDFYKLGHTRVGTYRRQIALQSGCPYRLELVGTLEGVEHERRLRDLWADKHVGGEWYEFASENGPSYFTERVKKGAA